MITFLAVVFLFGILIFFHELGHFIFAKLLGVKVLKFSIGFGPRLAGRRIGETDYVISALPLGGYVKPLGEEVGEEVPEEDKPRAFNFQPVWKRTVIILAGPIFNFILAYIVFVMFLSLSLPVPIPDLNSEFENVTTTRIENVLKDSPAMNAGLKQGDVIESINGKPINNWNEMTEIISKNPGKELTLKVKRKEGLIDIVVTPKSTKEKDKDGREITVGRIGVSKKLDFKVIESSSLLQAPVKGLDAVYEWTIVTLKIMVKLFTGDLSAKQVGGPISIIDTAAKAASTGKFTYFSLIAIISINLAVINLIPVPLLDGGHLMFLSIEALRGKPLSNEVLGVLTKIGMAILLLLIVFVFYNDFERVILPWIRGQ